MLQNPGETPIIAHTHTHTQIPQVTKAVPVSKFVNGQLQPDIGSVSMPTDAGLRIVESGADRVSCLSTQAPSYRFRSTVLKATTAPAEICIPNIFAAAFPEPLRSLTTIAFTGVASVSDLDWLEDCAMDSRC